MTILAAIQMNSTPVVSENLATAGRLIERAVARGATFIALPEYFACIGARPADALAIAEPAGDGPIQHFLAEAAARHVVWLLGGTLPIVTATRTRVRNASYLFGPDGTVAARYDKMHLFAFDDGTLSYDEGSVLEAGDVPVSVSAGSMHVRLSVCYDLRFPEFFRQPGKATSEPTFDLLCAPSAFTHETGRQHWDLLVRTRAVENLCYMLAPAQHGLHADGRRTWGHSMIVGPWGDVLDCVPEGEGIAIGEFSRARLADVRRTLPALQHRLL
ncbi:MAG TPA: carbon-nitrogen hydrolase family protein [Gemmatimonadaceae bacterium]|nr:carbon-nitrogen hydrolase family protein [Gemmatimonadaceae bacterium]